MSTKNEASKATESTATKTVQRFGKKLVSNAPYMTWKTPGQEVVGVIKNTTSKLGRFGLRAIVMIELDEPVDTYVGKGSTKMLKTIPKGETLAVEARSGMPALAELPVGTHVQIIYTGEVQADKGMAKAFDVFFES